ncbi:hypothetical protein [Bacillus sp. FSL R7-0685]|uniref:hypothetical protein n=1 Tax=Bacillus sp. FSL R7-0685 TaxID=2921589 RepID=UPI0030FCDAC6
MTETNAKIHVLADETLGGIKREYVEVDRKAEVGDKIVIVTKADGEEWYKNGDVFTVDREYRPADGDVESDGASSDTNSSGLIYREEYRVLEPTDIVHIGTQRYELTDRKAGVGEKVIVTKSDTFPVGHTDSVAYYYTSFDDGTVELSDGVTGSTFFDRTIEEYRVLVPVEAEADEPQPADIIDVVSNLATRVADLERENKKLRAALDEDMKIRSENARRYLALKDEIDTLHKDNRTLGEELARLKESTTGVKGEKLFTADELAAIIERLLMRP